MKDTKLRLIVRSEDFDHDIMVMPWLSIEKKNVFADLVIVTEPDGNELGLIAESFKVVDAAAYVDNEWIKASECFDREVYDIMELVEKSGVCLFGHTVKTDDGYFFKTKPESLPYHFHKIEIKDVLVYGKFSFMDEVESIYGSIAGESSKPDKPSKQTKVVNFDGKSVTASIDEIFTGHGAVGIKISAIINEEIKKNMAYIDDIDKAFRFISEFSEDRARMYYDYFMY